MDADNSFDRKRKAEEEEQQENNVSKRQVLESDFTNNDNETHEEYTPSSQPHSEGEETEQAQIKLETSTESVPVKQESAPISTNIPFDDLILLHLEATCDENPTNPAAVQVTKEKSEIIGKYDLFSRFLLLILLT